MEEVLDFKEKIVHKKIGLMLAIFKNGVYGEGGTMPLQIPEDQQHFKQKTKAQTVVMGRKTWDSLPVRYRPLPFRDNIVVSANPQFSASGATTVGSLADAITIAKTEKVFVIGGLYFWYEAMEIADEVWLTVIDGYYPITAGYTCTASRFLKFDEFWPDFRLNGTQSFQSDNRQKTKFEIQHWVRP